ncbi:interferon alpha-inducible protein 27-like protein 2A [Anneissia japonica]|uniref:interferon alpha-inducible protein 27-like protein 2A n=1 Tax=Anneissia japonica TaxID=1529436 RepID=UPI00142593DD|nr:interferon alpha-inducible protein 27-like protein 2A [Anneissia japonica]XP_033120441.1 interferon alpha-inducible protein 27-like protein 2A [Anneissia japonica]XP_033120442.1 interferon alpha-inducible protein 27-like protein 2A [Anneissia japonica]
MDLLVGALTGVAAFTAGPYLLGFTGAGIAAGSIATKLMSAAAIANGGGVAAGSAVAVLQSVGAVGLSVKGCALVAAGGAAVAHGVNILWRHVPEGGRGDQDEEDEEEQEENEKEEKGKQKKKNGSTFEGGRGEGDKIKKS